jgi:hypothetical protein
VNLTAAALFSSSADRRKTPSLTVGLPPLAAFLRRHVYLGLDGRGVEERGGGDLVAAVGLDKADAPRSREL